MERADARLNNDLAAPTPQKWRDPRRTPSIAILIMRIVQMWI